MKKVLAIVVLVVLSITPLLCFSETKEVVVEMGGTYTIDNYADIKIRDFHYVDYYAKFKEGKNGDCEKKKGLLRKEFARIHLY